MRTIFRPGKIIEKTTVQKRMDVTESNRILFLEKRKRFRAQAAVF